MVSNSRFLRPNINKDKKHFYTVVLRILKIKNRHNFQSELVGSCKFFVTISCLF